MLPGGCALRTTTLHPIAEAFQNCSCSISAALKGLLALRDTLRLFVFEYAGESRKGFVAYASQF